MCKYCDANSLRKMHDEVDAILAEDYSEDTEDKLLDTLDNYTVFTISGWMKCVFCFLDGTYWDEYSFGKWRVPFKHCPMCGRKLVD